MKWKTFSETVDKWINYKLYLKDIYKTLYKINKKKNLSNNI